MATESLSATQIGTLYRLIGPDQQRRADRFHFASDRHDFVAAHGLLCIALHQHFPELQFPALLPHSPSGVKPRLALDRPIGISISHSRGLVACATCEGFDIGVDCERGDREFSMDITRLCFTAAERNWLAQQGLDSERDGFLRLWTLKEAVLKADGSGLSTNLQSLTVLPDPPRIIRGPAALGEAKRWTLRQWRLPQGPIALAVRSAALGWS